MYCVKPSSKGGVCGQAFDIEGLSSWFTIQVAGAP
jgi:hypothetical protein